MRNTNQSFHSRRGFTLFELLASISIFGFVSAGAAFTMMRSISDVTDESRLLGTSLEAERALNLLTSELRMSGVSSPYLAAESSSSILCRNRTDIQPNSITFLVVHDDESSDYGRSAKVVRYEYNAAKKQLLRGENESKQFLQGCSQAVAGSVPLEVPANAMFAVAGNMIPANGADIFAKTNGAVQISVELELYRSGGAKTTAKRTQIVRLT